MLNEFSSQHEQWKHKWSTPVSFHHNRHTRTQKAEQKALIFPAVHLINPIILTWSKCINSPAPALASAMKDAVIRTWDVQSPLHACGSIKACRSVWVWSVWHERSVGHKRSSVHEALNQHTPARGLKAGVLHTDSQSTRSICLHVRL